MESADSVEARITPVCPSLPETIQAGSNSPSSSLATNSRRTPSLAGDVVQKTQEAPSTEPCLGWAWGPRPWSSKVTTGTLWFSLPTLLPRAPCPSSHLLISSPLYQKVMSCQHKCSTPGCASIPALAQTVPRPCRVIPWCSPANRLKFLLHLCQPTSHHVSRPLHRRV